MVTWCYIMDQLAAFGFHTHILASFVLLFSSPTTTSTHYGNTQKPSGCHRKPFLAQHCSVRRLDTAKSRRTSWDTIA